ncbi:hypothetical protein [Massilia sp. PWRC2]|uniref:hypothetical protein n=1 Tax=Massilia sp. PWRC2 TaxID=2804626 RepID=UPI003CEF5331
MRIITFTLAALLLAAGTASRAGAAETPVAVIRLTSPVEAGATDGASTTAPAAAAALLQPLADPTERLGDGSFATEAAAMWQLPAGGAALMPLSARTRYGALVTAPLLPASGPVLLLLLGCLIYLGRSRQHGFSLRPSRSLLARSDHAPTRR